MSLTQRAQAARARADATGDPTDTAVANAMAAAVDAAARELLTALTPEPDATGLPSPASAGYLSVVKIPPGPAGN
jgi:hypothetical protein